MAVDWILTSLWFLVPAACANAGASLSRRLPFLATPIDLGKTWRGEPVFGSHKTWRGLVVGSVVGFVVFLLQRNLSVVPFFRRLEAFDYQHVSVVFGLVLGLGAILGDVIKSFFKRRVGIKPGLPWFPFDQIDWIVGTLILSSFFVSLPLAVVFGAFVVGFVLHLITKVVGLLLHVDDVKI